MPFGRQRFNICFMLSIVPVDWYYNGMVPLYRCKGDVHECSNFRGISLLSVVGKVYGRIYILIGLYLPITYVCCT